MNTQDQRAPRLTRLTPTWNSQFWRYLYQDVDIYAAVPNQEGRRFSVWKADHMVADPAIDLLESLNLGLTVLRNFKLEPDDRNATLLHRDHPSNPCFAVNIFVRGRGKVHFYPDTCAPMLSQTDERGSTNPVFYATDLPFESYDLEEGELFIMDTSTIHKADTTGCEKSVVLASFIPKPQYRYEEALVRLGILQEYEPKKHI